MLFCVPVFSMIATSSGGSRHDTSLCRIYSWWTSSALGKGSEIALRLFVPAHARDRVLPTTLHLFEGRFVGGVPFGDLVLQVSVLGLDDLVGARPVVDELTRPTQLLAGHGLHGRCWIRTKLPDGSRNAQSRTP